MSEASIFNFSQESIGDKTRKQLKKMGVKSPSIKNKIEVRPGLWVVPKERIRSEKQKREFIEQFEKKQAESKKVYASGGLNRTVIIKEQRND